MKKRDKKGKFVKLILDKEKIRDLYLNQKKTIKEIGKLVNVGEVPISERLKEMKIEIRKNSQRLNLDIETIKDLYVNQKKTITNIAQSMGVSINPVLRRLQELKINRRKNAKKIRLDTERIVDLYINKRKSAIEIGKILGISKTTILRRLKEKDIEMRKGGALLKINLDLDMVKNLYVNEKKTMKEIGKLMDVSEITILDRLKRGDIDRRKTIGENNPNFNNWSSREPYGKDFSPELKKQIRKRDNYTCQECGKTQKEIKRLLDVHHIDYCKTNNNPNNLISLCASCHIKTNFNRKHWKRCFKERMVLREIFNPENILIFDENKRLIGMINKFKQGGKNGTKI